MYYMSPCANIMIVINIGDHSYYCYYYLPRCCNYGFSLYIVCRHMSTLWLLLLQISIMCFLNIIMTHRYVLCVTMCQHHAWYCYRPPLSSFCLSAWKCNFMHYMPPQVNIISVIFMGYHYYNLFLCYRYYGLRLCIICRHLSTLWLLLLQVTLIIAICFPLLC